MRGRVVEDLPEVTPDGRLAAADVDVEDLHRLELVDDAEALVGRQLARIAAPRARQAVDAREIARVRELPGQADRGIQTRLEMVDQPRWRLRPQSCPVLHNHARAGKSLERLAVGRQLLVGDARRRGTPRALSADRRATPRRPRACGSSETRAGGCRSGTRAPRTAQGGSPHGCRAARPAQRRTSSERLSRRRTCRRSRRPRSEDPPRRARRPAAPSHPFADRHPPRWERAVLVCWGPAPLLLLGCGDQRP